MKFRDIHANGKVTFITFATKQQRNLKEKHEK